MVNKHLLADGLQAINVLGDGNCFFRSVSVSLIGSENDHAMLRKSIVQFMSNEAASIIGYCDTPAAKQVRHCLQNLSRDGVWASEEVLRAAASYLCCAIHVYSGIGITWPLVYQPVGKATVTSSLPVILAFYEPGYYMAALRTQENQQNPTSANNISGSAATNATQKRHHYSSYSTYRTALSPE